MTESTPTGLGMFDIAGKGALVTGGASGLGLAIADVLARNGARVMIVDRNEDDARSAAAELVARGYAVRSATADVTEREAIRRAARAASEWDSGLDIVFANAGISSGQGRFFGLGQLADIDAERWQAVLDVNVTGVLTTVQECVAVMNNDGGRVVITSSIAGHRADPLVGYAYSASKAAVSHLGRNLAGELAPRGINVNVIAAGAFLTAIGRNNPGNAWMLQELAASTATGRMADPSEIEGLALLLASPAASHICGAVVAIDGGTLITQR